MRRVGCHRRCACGAWGMDNQAARDIRAIKSILFCVWKTQRHRWNCKQSKETVLPELRGYHGRKRGQIMSSVILWRIAVNLAEIADQLAEMNGYKVDSIYDDEEHGK